MKLALRLLVGLAVLFGSVRVVPRQVNPVSVSLLWPVNGSTSGVPVQLAAIASSSAAPVVKVEFYRDGILVATVFTPTSPPPADLRIQ